MTHKPSTEWPREIQSERSLAKCNNVSDLRRLAKRRLPAPMFHYIDGGADDEWSMTNNSCAFEAYELMPRYLRDVENINLTTNVLGCELRMPLILSPTGMSRLFHHEKEIGVARAAEKFGTMYSLSTMATTSLEDIAAVSDTPKMFQVYILKDRELTREFVKRCEEAKYQALCLTVDTPLAGNRERDAVHGMQMPPRFGIKSLWSFATHWRWAFNLFRNSSFKLANVEHRVDAIGAGTTGLIEYVNSQFDRKVTWDDAAWLAEQWRGPLVIKGLQSPEDAEMAVEIGASAIMISNHGGRQLDTTPAPIDCVRPIRDRVGDSLELIVDGGIRRGTHILKAIALGANACSIGRPYLYGLAAAGQRGVEYTLDLFRRELERDMALLGATAVAGLSSQHLARSGSTL